MQRVVKTISEPVGNGGEYVASVSVNMVSDEITTNYFVLTNPEAYVRFLRRSADAIEEVARVMALEKRK